MENSSPRSLFMQNGKINIDGKENERKVNIFMRFEFISLPVLIWRGR
jgi:hypothetical protein